MVVKWSDIYIGRTLPGQNNTRTQYEIENSESESGDLSVYIEIVFDEKGNIKEVHESKYRVYASWLNGSSILEYPFNPKNIRDARKVLDEVFPSDSMEKISTIVQSMIDQGETVNGYRFISQSKIYCTYVNPNGAACRIRKRKLADILDYNDSFPGLLNQEEIQKEFALVFEIGPEEIVSLIVSGIPRE